WVRRGLWQPGAPPARLDLSRHFDLTIEPGDVAQHWDEGPTRSRNDAVRLLGPVSLTDVLDPMPRSVARRALGLPDDRPVLLLAPGSGALGSVDATAAEVLEAVRHGHPDWLVAVTRQSIARHSVASEAGQVVVLDDIYPLARYLGAFDAAVSAAGYNAVHELLAARVPTLFIPSTNHLTDDQPVRARGAAAHGAALTVEGTIGTAVDRLLDDHQQAELRSAAASLPQATGGRDVAAEITRLAKSGTDARAWVPPAPTRPFPDLRARAEAGSGRSVLWTEHIDRRILAGDRPVEHLLPRSSVRYRQERRTIATWLYRT